MSDNSEGMAAVFAADTARLKKLLDVITEDGGDPQDYAIGYDEGGESIVDPETGTQYWFVEPAGIKVCRVVYYTLADGGPAMRVKCEFAHGLDSKPYTSLQHQDWFEYWQDYAMTGTEEEALDWYVDMLNAEEDARNMDDGWTS